MTTPQRRERPAGTGRGFANINFGSGSKPNTKRLPDNWRERLPDPPSYFARHIAKLSKPNANGWAQGLCKFHDDSNASFSVNLADDHGHWKCHAGCGKGDMIAFHERVTGLGFIDAVLDLIGGGR